MWLAAIVFVPWWLAFVVRTGECPRRSGPGWDRRRVVVGSLVGAAIVLTYYYSFFIGATHLALVLVVGAVAPRTRRASPFTVDRESWAVLGGAALLSAPYWVPIAVRALVNGGLDSLQNRYFERWMIEVPQPFLARRSRAS